MKVIGITGLKRSGKDTAASYYKDIHGYIQLSFAAKLKEITNKYLGCVSKDESDREQIQEFDVHHRNLIMAAHSLGLADISNEFMLRFFDVFEQFAVSYDESSTRYRTSYRKVLQLVGSEVCRHFQGDIWVKQVEDVLRSPENKDGKFVISDVRFDNEARMIRDTGGIILRVVREGTMNDGHSSEKGVDDKYIDYVIENTTFENLYRQLEEVL